MTNNLLNDFKEKVGDIFLKNGYVYYSNEKNKFDKHIQKDILVTIIIDISYEDYNYIVKYHIFMNNQKYNNLSVVYEKNLISNFNLYSQTVYDEIEYQINLMKQRI